MSTIHSSWQDDAQAIGARIALLLDASALPDEVKTGFAAMLPEMTPEQMDRLMAILEMDTNETVALTDDAFGDAVVQVQEEYEAKRDQAARQVVNNLQRIEDLVRQVE